MEEFSPIEFQQTRDFGKKINETFWFIRQNFKPLVKSILIIAGPAVLIGSIFMGSFFSDLFTMMPNMSHGNPEESLKYFTSAAYWMRIGLLYVFISLCYISTMATINTYAELYYQRRTNLIQVSEVWERARGLMLKYLGTLLMMVLCMAIFIFVIVVLSIVLKLVSTAIMVLFIIAAVFVFIYLLVGVSLIFFIQVHEGTGFFEAANRSLQLIKGKWWSTFGISFVLSLIGGAISYIFIIPYYIFIFITATHSASASTPELPESMKTATYVFLTLYYMSQVLLQTLPQLGLIFQYFNLVERREAKGLMSDIEKFGQTTNKDSREETF